MGQRTGVRPTPKLAGAANPACTSHRAEACDDVRGPPRLDRSVAVCRDRIPAPEHATAGLSVRYRGRAELCAPYGELVRVMAYTGLRIGEALNLRVKDWHPDDGRLLVQRGKTVSARRPVFVPELLRDGLNEQAAGRAGDDPLFRAPRGGKLSRGQVESSLGDSS